MVMAAKSRKLEQQRKHSLVPASSASGDDIERMKDEDPGGKARQ